MDYEKYLELINEFGDIRKPCLYRRTIEDLEESYNEEFKKHNMTEICMTFKQAWRNIHTNQEIEDQVVSFFYDMMVHNELDSILLVREYGDSNNLHYHGIIRLKTHCGKTLSQVKSKIGKLFGKNTIKAVHNQSQYYTYITKEQASNDEQDFIYLKSKFV